MKGIIGHIVLAVGKWERSVAFYDTLLTPMGFKQYFHESGDWEHVKCWKRGSHQFEIAYEKNVKNKSFNRYVGLNHLAFYVDSKKSVFEIQTIFPWR